MTEQRKRLTRLLQAQAKVTKSLEFRLGLKEQQISGLRRTQEELEEISRRIGSVNPVLFSSSLRHLSATASKIDSLREEAVSLRRDLLSSKVRRDAVACKLNLVERTADRKRIEDESLEISCVMYAKGPGKDDVRS